MIWTTPSQIIAPVQIAASTTTYYTVPTKNTALISRLTFTNTDTSARTITVYFVPSAGTAGNDNMLVDAQSIPVDTTWICQEAEGHILPAGATIQMIASSASKITAIGSAILVS